MPREGFEPAIPMFERAKTVRVFDHAAIGTGDKTLYMSLLLSHWRRCEHKWMTAFIKLIVIIVISYRGFNIGEVRHIS
jgi:hypothetical protein